MGVCDLWKHLHLIKISCSMNIKASWNKIMKGIQIFVLKGFCIVYMCVKSIVATPLWPSVGVKPNTWKSRGFGVLRDSRMFKAR